MMRSRMVIEKPGAVEVTLTVTMTALEWEVIRDWLRQDKKAYGGPVQQFANALDDLLGQVQKVLWHNETAQDDE